MDMNDVAVTETAGDSSPPAISALNPHHKFVHPSPRSRGLLPPIKLFDNATARAVEKCLARHDPASFLQKTRSPDANMFHNYKSSPTIEKTNESTGKLQEDLRLPDAAPDELAQASVRAALDFAAYVAYVHRRARSIDKDGQEKASARHGLKPLRLDALQALTELAQCSDIPQREEVVRAHQRLRDLGQELKR